MLRLGQGKNEQVVPLKQEEDLLEQQKGEGVSLLEQEHWVPQRISKGTLVVTEGGLHLKLQMHSSCLLEQWWMKQLPGKPGKQLLLL